jgi:hypothetical protein
MLADISRRPQLSVSILRLRATDCLLERLQFLLQKLQLAGIYISMFFVS